VSDSINDDDDDDDDDDMIILLIIINNWLEQSSGRPNKSSILPAPVFSFPLTL